jgi:hypothetical protein
MNVFDPMLVRCPIAGETYPMAGHRHAAMMAVMLAVWTLAWCPYDGWDLEIAGADCLDAEEDVDYAGDGRLVWMDGWIREIEVSVSHKFSIIVAVP